MAPHTPSVLSFTREQCVQILVLGAVLRFLFRKASPRHILGREQGRAMICAHALLACRVVGTSPDAAGFMRLVGSVLSETHREIREREALEIFPDAHVVACLAQELLLDHFREAWLSLNP